MQECRPFLLLFTPRSWPCLRALVPPAPEWVGALQVRPECHAQRAMPEFAEPMCLSAFMRSMKDAGSDEDDAQAPDDETFRQQIERRFKQVVLLGRAQA